MTTEKVKLTDTESSTINDLVIAVQSARTAIYKTLPDADVNSLETYFTNAFASLADSNLKLFLYGTELAEKYGYKQFINYGDGNAVFSKDDYPNYSCQEIINLHVMQATVQSALFAKRDFSSEEERNAYYTMAAQYLASILIARSKKEEECHSKKETT